MAQFIVFLTQTPIEAENHHEAARKAAEFFMLPETDKYLVVESDDPSATNFTHIVEYPVMIKEIKIGPARPGMGG